MTIYNTPTFHNSHPLNSCSDLCSMNNVYLLFTQIFWSFVDAIFNMPNIWVDFTLLWIFFPFCHWPKSLFTLLTFSPHFPLPSSSSLYGYLYLWHFMIFLNVSTWHSLHGRSHHFIKGICTCNFSKVVFHFSPITTSKSPSAYCPFIFSIITRKKNYNLSLHIDGREEITTKSGSKTERNENKIIFTLLLKSLK